MSVSIIRGATDKPVASETLAELIERRSDWSGKLFIGFPVIAAADGPRRIDALFVSEERGLIVFDLIEGRDIGGFGARQDELANRLEAKLKPHPELTDRRDLRIPIHTVSFAPALTGQLADPTAPSETGTALNQSSADSHGQGGMRGCLGSPFRQ